MASISISGGGGGGPAGPSGPDPLYPATPATSTETVPYPYAGDDATVDMVLFPTDNPVLAVGIEGDTAPRMLYGADSGMGIVWGNGAVDPWADDAPGAAVCAGGNPFHMLIYGWNGATVDISSMRVVNSDVTITKPGAAIKLTSSDGTGHYDVSVNNAGALTVNGAPVGGGGGGGGAVSATFLSGYKWGVDF